MQIKPLNEADAPEPASVLAAGSNDNHTPSSSSQLSTVPSSCNRIVKQAITPISGRSSLIKLLNGSKSALIKTIGDRIVVPMKVSTKPSRCLNAKVGPASTFQMALSAPSKNSLSEKTTKTDFVKINILDLDTANTIRARHKSVESEHQDLDTSVTNDLNKFMNSITKNVFFPIKKSDEIELFASDEEQKKPKFSSNNSILDQQEDDDELTCLSWLSSNNKQLLKTIRMCNPDDPGIGSSGDDSDNDNVRVSNKLIFTASSRVHPQNSSSHHVSNDFMFNPLSKPPYSFSCLIFMAIEDSYLKRLPVKAIYSWVCKHFPYYRTAQPGWKNSIRHNLSLNRCFMKANCRQDSAKGSLWSIDPAYRPNLVQALKRSPFYPYLHPTGVGQPLSLNNLANLLPGVHAGRVPTWTPALPPSTLWADPDMASAALNLMGLRGKDEITSSNTELISNTLEEIFRDADWLDHSKNFRRRNDSTESIGTEEVIISGDGQDHTYSAALPLKKRVKREEKRCKSPESEKSAPDAAYEFETPGFSDEDLMDDVIDEILEDIVIDGNHSDAEDQSLFDSGFGSIKSYKMAKKRKISSSSSKSLLRHTDAPSSKHPIKPVAGKSSRYAKPRRLRVKTDSKSLKKSNGRPCRQFRKNTFRKKAKKRPVIGEGKLSDIDSGKDSPKCDRTARSRRYRQRACRFNNKSNYHTRSSSYKLLGQEKPNAKKSPARKRNRSFGQGDSATCDNDDDEIKLAAGSLMRLAGLVKSPVKSDYNYYL